MKAAVAAAVVVVARTAADSEVLGGTQDEIGVQAVAVYRHAANP